MNNKSKLELYLDGLAEGKTGELTFHVRDYTPAQKQAIEEMATAKGFHVSGDGKYILVRRKTLDNRTTL
jgi:hypothetical protein